MSDFDLSQFEAIDTATLKVMNQKDEELLWNGNPVTIEMYGPGSPQYTKAQSKMDSANQARLFAGVRGKKTKTEEQHEDLVEKLVACTKAIHNFPIEGGAKALYSNRRLDYITQQAARFVDDWANFTKGN